MAKLGAVQSPGYPFHPATLLKMISRRAAN